MRYLLVTVGKNFDRQLENAIGNFTGRLNTWVPTEWLLLPNASGATTDLSKAREAESILKVIPEGAHVIVLDETGTALSTPQLAARLDELATRSVRSIIFIIGGAHGFGPGVLARADLVWSLSPLTFPHQLVRLILAEQLYRAHTILRNLPYHHA